MVKKLLMVVALLALLLVGTATMASAIGGNPTPLPSYDSINYQDGVVTVTGRLIGIPGYDERPWSFQLVWNGSRWTYGLAFGPFHWALRYQTLMYLNQPLHNSPAIFNYVGVAADAYRDVLHQARLATFGS